MHEKRQKTVEIFKRHHPMHENGRSSNALPATKIRRMLRAKDYCGVRTDETDLNNKSLPNEQLDPIKQV
jgi:hypothetical protein